jgi:hypothetical protein
MTSASPVHVCSLLIDLIQNGIDDFLVLGGGLGAEISLVLAILSTQRIGNSRNHGLLAVGHHICNLAL